MKLLPAKNDTKIQTFLINLQPYRPHKNEYVI